MKSALKIVAFSNGCLTDGICALMEAAIDAMIKQGHLHAAAHAQMSLDTYIMDEVEASERKFADISVLG
jgi:hypothetical protein